MGRADPRTPALLMLDIETSPSCVWTWDFWGANISADKVIQPSEMISWAAGWYDEDDIMFRSVHDDGRGLMVQHMHRLLDQADWVCHYNGRKFDMPKLSHEFLLAGLPPPSPVKQIDLCAVVKKVFSFTHNSLANVLKVLGMDEQKMDHGQGFDLWVRCMADDPEAWATLKEYNIQDVAVLRGLYAKLLPWIPNHPSYGAFLGADVCPACGSAKLRKRGWEYTSTGRYQRLRCTACGKHCRETRRESATSVTQVAGS